ncbi:zinc-binding alcohol dehydrogenase family protein [Aspergillus stella-maris]|uniref:zinc-binding alcohol dehydrogenase family protein n=1 Tax=Aspergillus stella-maris TaxID=1810926 RepID=UPI003CCD6389
MKEGITMVGPAIKIVDSPIPEPNDDQVLIKVMVAGANPKNWKGPEWAASGNIISPILEGIKEPINQGDDIAGIVENVGSNVVEFKPGDRVAAFHEMYTKGGSYAEYAVAWSHTTFHLPDHTSFEEAATIPLAALTAAVSLYANHRLPFPWRPAQASTPLIVYGASTAVGAFTIRLACNSNLHPIIAVAGKGCGYVNSIIDKSKGDIVIDYHHGADKTVSAIKDRLEEAGVPTVQHALDAAITPVSIEVLKQVVAPGGVIDFALPTEADVSPAVKSMASVGSVHNMPWYDHNAELGFIFCRYFTRALQDKTFSGHPYEVRLGGLAGIEDALRDLKAGKASACKYVFRISETPGITA